ncbi:hypothetical protein HOP52_12240 [Halomonas campisalis]|uniref:Uncharacterized protein n=1 Tax=Billgrantia campisalis TaxID=74661 RepID=A0ABS9PB86_9GAMM|nr:hypothetical protein [Halomonas campisalis]MCG6658522.1 hypothetical protein [Halomonas campisalis]MDR5863383.1 hypothetical protein [Halomonas campisalis]
MRKVINFFWPILEKASNEEVENQKSNEKELIKKIRNAELAQNPEIALDEARRLFDAEQERRRGADSKAGLYLAAITALVPVLSSVLPDLWKGDDDKLFSTVLLLFFVGALIYLLRAAFWAFSTIKVSRFSQLGALDIVSSWGESEPPQELTKKLMCYVSFNMSSTNEKVSCIKMTHEFFLRSFLCFLLYLAVQAVWPAAFLAFRAIYESLILSFLNCA